MKKKFTGMTISRSCIGFIRITNRLLLVVKRWHACGRNTGFSREILGFIIVHLISRGPGNGHSGEVFIHIPKI